MINLKLTTRPKKKRNAVISDLNPNEEAMNSCLHKKLLMTLSDYAGKELLRIRVISSSAKIIS